LAEALGAAIDALTRENGAQDSLSAASQELGRVARLDRDIGELARRLDEAATDVADISSALVGRVAETDPGAIDAVRQRLEVLARLHRKYGADDEAVLAYLERAQLARRRELELEESTHDAAQLQRQLDDAQRAAEGAARELGAVRRSAAERLESKAARELRRLALEQATFKVELGARPLYEGGLESVDFLLAAGPGETPRRLAKVASGGELSRVALALHLLTASGVAPTMIFDEVDAGVGGEAAQAVGRALDRLARASGAQTIVVTHLPQVAAFADAHYRVTKEQDGSRARAIIERVEADERVAELSRMLAGLPASERAQQHAQELLDLARKTRVA
jgi:DNA repair protein RecN (Recombination protein N)